jgi:hypothetical protein
LAGLFAVGGFRRLSSFDGCDRVNQ